MSPTAPEHITLFNLLSRAAGIPPEVGVLAIDVHMNMDKQPTMVVELVPDADLVRKALDAFKDTKPADDGTLRVKAPDDLAGMRRHRPGNNPPPIV